MIFPSHGTMAEDVTGEPFVVPLAITVETRSIPACAKSARRRSIFSVCPPTLMARRKATNRVLFAIVERNAREEMARAGNGNGSDGDRGERTTRGKQAARGAPRLARRAPRLTFDHSPSCLPPI